MYRGEYIIFYIDNNVQKPGVEFLMVIKSLGKLKIGDPTDLI